MLMALSASVMLTARSDRVRALHDPEQDAGGLHGADQQALPAALRLRSGVSK